MYSTAIPWITAVAAACSAIAAAVSACFSWRSSRTAANAALTTLILKFRDQYATNEMFIDLRNLRAWHDKYGSQFAVTWQQKLKNDKEAQIVDRSRRRVTGFFSDIIDLHDAGLVPKRIEKLLTDFAYNFIRASIWFSIGCGMLFWWQGSDIIPDPWDFDKWLHVVLP